MIVAKDSLWVSSITSCCCRRTACWWSGYLSSTGLGTIASCYFTPCKRKSFWSHVHSSEDRFFTWLASHCYWHDYSIELNTWNISLSIKTLWQQCLCLPMSADPGWLYLIDRCSSPAVWLFCSHVYCPAFIMQPLLLSEWASVLQYVWTAWEAAVAFN